MKTTVIKIAIAITQSMNDILELMVEDDVFDRVDMPSIDTIGDCFIYPTNGDINLGVESLEILGCELI